MSVMLEFVSAPFGLEPLVDFDLSVVHGAGHLYALRSLTDPGIRLYVLAAPTLPAYAPELTDDQAEALALESSENAAVYLVLNPSSGPTTVNLLAPIVVNTKTGAAAQLILQDKPWSITAPLSELF